jgi:hypothetical protein
MTLIADAFRTHPSETFEIALAIGLFAIGSVTIVFLILSLLFRNLVKISKLGTEVISLQGQVCVLAENIKGLGVHSSKLEGNILQLGEINGEMGKGVADINRFVTIAPEVAGTERMNLLKTSLMMQPEEYTRLISDLSSDDEDVPQSISIVGSMVGFSLTIACDLAELAVSKRAGLDKIFFIGPLHPVEKNGVAGDLVGPVWNFQLLFLSEYFKRLPVEALDEEWMIELKSFYLPFDPLSAAIFVPERYVVNLQALSPEMLEKVVKRTAHLVGMLYRRDNGGGGIYERFEHAIASYQRQPGIRTDTIAISARSGKLTISSSGLVLPLDGLEDRFLNLDTARPVAAGPNILSVQTLEVERDAYPACREQLLGQIKEGIKSLERNFHDVERVNKALVKYREKAGAFA